jgi:hypothetical protein
MSKAKFKMSFIPPKLLFGQGNQVLGKLSFLGAMILFSA